jgi:hypothetical protein
MKTVDRYDQEILEGEVSENKEKNTSVYSVAKVRRR